MLLTSYTQQQVYQGWNQSKTNRQEMSWLFCILICPETALNSFQSTEYIL